MISTDDLSVQDATQSQGYVSDSDTQDTNLITSALENLKLKKDKSKQVIEESERKLKPKKLFDDENKENSASKVRRSPRIAGEKVSEEMEFFMQENPYHPKELSNVPPIKFPNRFEKTPDAIAITVEPLKNEVGSTILSQEELNKDFKDFKNYHSEKVDIALEKKDGVRVCETKEQQQFSQFFSIKTACSKVRFFAPLLKPEEHKKRYGAVSCDKNKLDQTLDAIKELKNKQNNENDNSKKSNPTLTLEKLEKKPELLAYVISRVKPVKKYHRIPVTAETLKKWQYKGQKSRTPTQLSTFGISAKHYAKLFGFDPDDELTHALGFSLGGTDGVDPQVRKNLFVATSGANTWMMLGEDLVRYLLIDHKDKVKKVFVSVEVHFVPGTKKATRIDYKVEWTRVNSNKEKSISFKVNAEKYDAPPKLEKYLRKIADRELEHQHPGEVFSNKTNNQNKATLKPQFMDAEEMAELNNNNNNDPTDDHQEAQMRFK